VIRGTRGGEEEREGSFFMIFDKKISIYNSTSRGGGGGLGGGKGRKGTGKRERGREGILEHSTGERDSVPGGCL